MEDLFGLVDVNVRVEPSSQAWALREDFIFLILRTLELTFREVSTEQCRIFLSRGDSTQTKRPVEHFLNLVARRWEPQSDSGQIKDSIICLNYDLVIERAIEGQGLAADYCLPPTAGRATTESRPRVKLLKLHGSANWATCTGCRRVKVLPLQNSTVSEIESTPCECGTRQNLTPCIVPPTWSKGDYPKDLDSVWQSAFKELTTAQRLILIGLSLPSSDRFLRFLLGLGLARNRDLDRIVILNTNKTSCEDLFTNLPRWAKVVAINAPFEVAVISGNLQDNLGQRYLEPQPAW